MANNTPQYQIKIENKDYTALGISKVITGVENPNETEIIQVYSPADDRILNKSRNKVEAQEIYDIGHRRKNWFMLDLETGRGCEDSWYPGCVVLATVIGPRIPVKAEPTYDSATLEELTNAIVILQDTHYLPENMEELGDWCKVKFTQVGYIESRYLMNIRYGDPS